MDIIEYFNREKVSRIKYRRHNNINNLKRTTRGAGGTLHRSNRVQRDVHRHNIRCTCVILYIYIYIVPIRVDSG